MRLHFARLVAIGGLNARRISIGYLKSMLIYSGHVGP